MSTHVNNFTADKGDIIVCTAMFVILYRTLYCKIISVFFLKKGAIMQCKILEYTSDVFFDRAS